MYRGNDPTTSMSRGGWPALLGCLAALATAAPAQAEGGVGTPSAVGQAAAAAARSQAAWYVGSTSAGTRIDFRLSPAGQWVRDFHFGSPTISCATSELTDRLVDGNFPLAGLRVRNGSFDGMLQELDDTPQTPDQMGVWLRGRFSDQQQQAAGTIEAGSRSCDSYQRLSFTAGRVRSLPARPAHGRQYAGRTVRGNAIRFRVSRSGRRLIGFRVAPVATSCTDSDKSGRLALTHSRPVAGLRQRADGGFSGILSSRVTTRHPARTRARVSALFLSRAEATGSVQLLGRTCRYETLPWRALLVR